MLDTIIKLIAFWCGTIKRIKMLRNHKTSKIAHVLNSLDEIEF